MSNYEDFLPAQRLGRSLSLSADGAMIAYASDASGQFNLWIQPASGGPARQLTFFTDRAVREVAWSPDGKVIAFTADANGDEQYQVHVMPAAGGDPVMVSKGTGQHFLAEKAPFGPKGQLVYNGPGEDPAIPDLITCDLASGVEERWHGPVNGYGFAVAVSPDGEHVLGGTLASNTECRSWLGHTDTPGTALEPVTDTLPGGYCYPGPWAADSQSFHVLATGTDQDHVSLARFSPSTGRLSVIDSPPWDVEDAVASADGRTLAWTVNQDGYSVLRALRDGTRLELPPVPGGVISAMSLSADGTVLAVRLDTPGRPATPAILHLGTSEPPRYLTGTPSAGVNAGSAQGPELIRYRSADGTLIPAWLHLPTGPGPHPVLLSVHGGPQVQARPEYDPLHRCLLAAGIAILEPNIRGSSGYGHDWQNRIDRDWGGVDLDDLAAAHSWLTDQSWADPGRIAVYGMSYGGFAALSCMTRLPALWAAGVSVCGPSNLDSLARSMPPSWSGMVIAMFGDPDDPGDAEELHNRSPLTYAGQIAAPLLVIQGANDPRVPKAESDQIIAAARANGADARYLVFDDEGHGFTSRANDIKANQAIVDFLTTQLLPEANRPATARTGGS